MSRFNASLQDTSVLVTGATGGIGQRIVEQLVVCGATVFAAARDETKLHTLVAHAPDRIIPLAYDVTDEKAVKEAFRFIQKKQTESKVGRFTGLVNNAGTMQEASLLLSSQDLITGQMQVNFHAAYQHMQLASRLMTRNRHGAIVNILSQVGEQGSEGMSAYAASKAALSGATKSLAKELAAVGIRVNGVAPGFIDTDLTAHYKTDKRDAVISRTAMKTLGRPEDVASAVVFLLSEGAAFTTGHILPVDGLFHA